MNISYNWLKEYVNFDLTPDEVAEALTSIGLETGGVEEVQTIKGGLTSVIFAGSIIKFRNFVRSILGKNRNFRNIFCFQQGIHSCLIGFQHSTYKGFTVHVTAVFCSKHIFMIVFSYLDQQRHL